MNQRDAAIDFLLRRGIAGCFQMCAADISEIVRPVRMMGVPFVGQRGQGKKDCRR